MVFTSIVRRYAADVRVRFAPSPTGYLHLGGLRTALYNYLFARGHNGKFILRIEDTDQTRIVEGAARELQRDLQWCGIEIDEGPGKGGKYGPYLQSQRLNIYRDHVNTLLENGSAYHCFCTDKRLQLLRREALKIQEVPKYDNKCRSLTEDEVKSRLTNGDSSCIRFKLSDDEDSFTDLIYGKLTYNVYLNEGDPVIIKTDGFPTYHFANVVDDHLMRISHVLRGVEWQISTMKHILMYRAFGWTPPVFGHLPLLMNADGTKLSKRQGDIKIGAYRDDRIFPLALLNFIVMSGGGFTKDGAQKTASKVKCHTISELSKQFDINKVKNHSGKLMPERLLEFNRLELTRRLEDRLEEVQLVIEMQHLLKIKYPEKVVENSLNLDAKYIKTIMHWAVNRIGKLSDLFDKDLEFIWVKPKDYNLIVGTDVISLFRDKLRDIDDLDREKLGPLLKQFSQDHKVKYGDFMKSLRSILSGLKEGPGVAEIIEILGKENAIERLNVCLGDVN